MEIPQDVHDALIFRSQVTDDIKSGIADGGGQEANQVGNFGFRAAVAEITLLAIQALRLGIKALRKYVGDDS